MCGLLFRRFRAMLLPGLMVAGWTLAPFPSPAQVSTGSLHGIVSDATGAVVPNARITLKDQATNSTRDTTSNRTGFFNFAAVQPANYTVTVTAAGFNAWEAKNIAFTQAANVSLPNIVLEVGTTKQQIEVVSGADAVVPSDTGQVSQTLNQHMITELAIQGRDAAELIKIMPGMAMATGLNNSMWSSLTTQSNTGPIGQFSAQGTQPNGGMTMTSDGANLLDPGNQGTQVANINQNQIAEFSIMTNAYGAEFAKGPVTFQAIGKSGGSDFHGQAYFYARHSTFDAEDSFLKASGVAAPQESYYYPGGDFGGPVILPKIPFNRNRDKLFFYTAYEYMNQNPEGSLIQRFIPTQQMMQGNFSPSYLSSLGPNFANGTFKLDANPPCPNTCTNNVNLPGGIIPASLIDPNSVALWKTMPQPNIDPNSNATGANYQYLVSQPVKRWEYRLRGDYNISEKMKVFVSWNRQDETDLNPISIWWGTNNDLPYPSSMPANQVSQVLSANVTNIFTPTLTNEFVFATATFINPIGLTDASAVDPAKVGFNMVGLYKNPYTPQIPNTLSWGNGVPGYFAPTFGQEWQGGNFGKLSQAPNISDNLSKVLGTHTLKFGFYWDLQRNQQTGSNFGGANQGVLDFENYGSQSSNNPAADFVMARVTGFTQANSSPVQDFHQHQYSFYANDQWKATRRLTLTLGLRFDHMGQWYPVGNGDVGLAIWDPSLYDNTSAAKAFTGLAWHGIDSSIPISGFPSRGFFLEPRLGVAYDLFGNGKTVLRGGFGVYRYQVSYNTASGGYNAPLNVVTANATSQCCIGYQSFNQFSPTLGVAGLGTTIGALQKGDERTPYTQSYNVTISQRLPWQSLAEVQYVGSRSRDLLLDGSSNGNLGNINNIPLGAFYKPDPTTGLVTDPYSPDFNANHYYPYANYTGIQLVSHGSYSNYNAFVVTWQKQNGPVTFMTNYSFSKAMGVRDGYSGNGAQAGYALNPFDLGANYGVLGFDHTHIFNASYIINLPKVQNVNKFVAGVTNGWTFSGITQIQSGAPIQPNSAQGELNASFGNDTLRGISKGVSATTYLGTNAFGGLPLVLTCDPSKGLSSGQYFNPSCFAPPAPGQVGSIVWPYIKGPAFFNSDLSLFKNFNITERQKIQVRFEAFNFLNHPLKQFNAPGNNADIGLNFSGPNGSLAQTNQNANTTGRPLYTVGRRVVEFALKYSF